MELDKYIFRSTEGKLYSYYRKIKEVDRKRERIEELDRKIREIEEDIKNTNVNIDYYQGAMPISERVQTSSNGTSYAETQIVKAIDDLEREKAFRIRTKLKLKAKIRTMEDFILYMSQTIDSLNLGEENMRFIELKYGDGADMIIIANKLNMAKTTAYRKRKEIVTAVAETIKIK